MCPLPDWVTLELRQRSQGVEDQLAAARAPAACSPACARSRMRSRSSSASAPKDVEVQLAAARRGVDLLLQRPEPDARPLQLPDGLDEMGQGAGKPIQPPDDQSVLGTKLEESRPVTVTEPETVHLAKERGLRAEILQRVLGFGSYETAWAWMHKLRRVMVRPDREQFMGDVELDEVFVGGRSTGRMGAGTGKVPIMVAVERGEGRRLGRVRMQVADRPNTAATSGVRSRCRGRRIDHPHRRHPPLSPSRFDGPFATNT